MKTFDAVELGKRGQAAGKAYLEFLRIPEMSMGLYQLPAGGSDPQTPHAEDEVYYIVSGRAQIAVAGEDHPVQAGSIVYVEKHVEHHFHSIEVDLSVLVFFAPAEYSRKKRS